MKHVAIKSMFLILFSIAGLSVSLFAKTRSVTPSPKVYVVINKANWCPTCQANKEKIINEIIPACKNLNVKVVANDLTNKRTIAASDIELNKNDIFNSVKDIQSTGLILLVDAKTKKIIKQISVKTPADEIMKEITAAQI